MTRQQRLNLKKKAIRQTWLAVAMTALFILNIVLLIVIDWRPDAMSDPESMSNAGIGLVLFIMTILMIPLGLALHFNVRSTWTLKELYDERRRMYKEKKRLYVTWFMEALVQGNYQKAKDIHNDLITGETRALTRGIMVGLLHMAGDSEDKEMALKHMSSIPDEVYDPAKEN